MKKDWRNIFKILAIGAACFVIAIPCFMAGCIILLKLIGILPFRD